MEKYNLADHGQAQAGAGLAGGIYLVEALPDFVQVLCRDADAVILHRKDGEKAAFPGSLAGQADTDMAVLPAIFAGIFQEIDDDP